MISLHSTHPGNRGERGRLHGPVRVSGGVWSFKDATATLNRGLELGEVTQPGRATHIGLWSRNRVFAWSGELEDVQMLTAGTTVNIERRKLVVGLGA